jgi:hypothetical protein
MRLDDPSDNGGRGWRRLESDEVAALAYIAIRLAIRGVKADLAGRAMPTMPTKPPGSSLKPYQRGWLPIRTLALPSHPRVIQRAARARAQATLDQSREQDDDPCCRCDLEKGWTFHARQSAAAPAETLVSKMGGKRTLPTTQIRRPVVRKGHLDPGKHN